MQKNREGKKKKSKMASRFVEKDFTEDIFQSQVYIF